MVSTRVAFICYAFLFLAGLATAEKRTFSVVSFGQKVRLSVNEDAPVAMKRSHSGQPLYSVNLDVDDSVRYHYVEDGKAEDFKRKFAADASVTINDFFGRKDTIKTLPQLSPPFETGLWTRGMGQVNPFNETYIPTLHLTGNNVVQFFKKPPAGKQTFSAFFVLQNETRLFEGVKLEASNKRFPKFAIRMELGDNDMFYGRNVIKFRFGENDPTFLREKLYTDLLVAVGAPVHQTGLIRVYADGVPIGLYILQDDTADSMFIRSEFYAKGDAPSNMGYPLDAGTGADFLWTDKARDPVDPWQAFDPVGSEPGHRNYRSDATNDRVVELSRALHNLKTTDKQAVDEFDKKWFDIDTFFKAMALEYALGHWDSYWGLTTNFVVYDDPNESDPPNSYKFYFLDQDFEFSFGSCLNDEFNQFGQDFTKQSYKTLLNREWGQNVLDAKRRTMLDKLIPLKPSELTKRFELILITIVKHLLNPVALFGRIDALAERYRDELKWDRSLQRLRVGSKEKAMDYKWTLEDLDYGINGYPPGIVKGENAGIAWGLKPYIQERADAVAKEFDFDYRNVDAPPTPTVSQPVKQDVEELQQPDPSPPSTSAVPEPGAEPSHVDKATASILTALLMVASGLATVMD